MSSTQGEREALRALQDLKPGVYRTCDTGSCAKCGGYTSSGSYRYCPECAWEIVRAALSAPQDEAGAERIVSGAPTVAGSRETADWPRLRAVFERIWPTLENYMEGRIGDIEVTATLERLLRPPASGTGEEHAGWYWTCACGDRGATLVAEHDQPTHCPSCLCDGVSARELVYR